MPQFMEQHTDKNQENKKYAINRCRLATGTVIKPADPGQEEKKCDMHSDLDPEDPEDAK